MHAFWAITCLCLAFTAWAQSPDLTKQEQTLCRPDALRYCLFKIGDADALRQCLRDNRDKLSTPCLELLKSRGN